MRTKYNFSNYGNDLSLTTQDAKFCSQSGSCDDYVKEVSEKKYVKKQTSLFNPDQLRKELDGYGAWDDEQLQDHEQNIQRWIWISAGNIVDDMHA